ncbi:uncharacterized protein WCC33_016818 [Rhinophrynus dorsalis]
MLHGFPKDITQIKEWLVHTNQDFGDVDLFAQKVLEGKKTDLYRMCSKHFTSNSYYYQGSKILLKRDAVPTVFPTVVLSTEYRSATGPPMKRFRLDDWDGQPTMSGIATGTPFMPIRSDACTQTERKVKHTSTVTNPRHGMRSVGCQTSLMYFKENVAFQANIMDSYDHGMLPAKEQKRKLQQDHFYPRVFSKPFIIRETNSRDVTIKMEEDILHEEPSNFPLYNSTDISYNEEDIVHEEPPNSPLTYSLCNTTSSSHMEATGVSIKSECDEVYRINEPEEMEPESSDESLFKERTFLVFESCLDRLFCMVSCGSGLNCSAPVNHFEKKVDGSFLSVTGHCTSGHTFHMWQSQPQKNQVPMGNFLISAAILCSGSVFSKVYDMFKIIGLQQIARNTFYRYQRNYLFPAIDLRWHQERELIKQTLSGKGLCVTGDCLFDDPGPSSKYCTYTLMDVTSQKILGVEILKVGKNKSLAGIEKETFQNCLDNALLEGFDINIVAMDRHIGIKKLMCEQYKDIMHQTDVWHLTRRLENKLLAASKKRRSKEIEHCIQSISSHLRWCAKTCGGNLDSLREKWKSILNHISNAHVWKGGISSCSHNPKDKVEDSLVQWIMPSQPAYDSLQRIVQDPQLLEDMENLQTFCPNVPLEVFHSKVLRYRPKRTCFSMDAVKARTKLAALSHNKSLSRKQATIRSPRKQSAMVCTNDTKQWTVKPAIDQAMNNYVMDILMDGWRICSSN